MGYVQKLHSSWYLSSFSLSTPLSILLLFIDFSFLWFPISLCFQSLSKFDDGVLVPIRLDIEIDGQSFKDAFTWNRSVPDLEVVVFAKKTVKDLKLPPAFITQSIQSQLTEFRSFEGQDMYILVKISFQSSLIFKVNNKLIEDQFLT
ncbi:hypothetical protein IC582_004004 [Cucumis melo]